MSYTVTRIFSFHFKIIPVFQLLVATSDPCSSPKLNLLCKKTDRRANPERNHDVLGVPGTIGFVHWDKEI